MLNIKKFLLAIGLIPKSTSQINERGELEVLSTDGKIRYHNGTSVSPLVTESHSATLTNKTIDYNQNTILNLPSGGGGGGSGEGTLYDVYDAAATSGGNSLISASASNQTKLKTLVAGTNTTITSNTDTITISSSGGGGGISTPISASILNSASTPVDIVGLVFNPATVLSFVVEYTIVRSSSLEKICSVGRLRGVFNSSTVSWSISDDFAGDNPRVDFSINASGQVQYVSVPISGTSYVGVLKYITLITYDV